MHSCTQLASYPGFPSQLFSTVAKKAARRGLGTRLVCSNVVLFFVLDGPNIGQRAPMSVAGNQVHVQPVGVPGQLQFSPNIGQGALMSVAGNQVQQVGVPGQLQLSTPTR